MSYTFTPKPSQNRLSQPRGRGRGQLPRSTNPGNRQNNVNRTMDNDRYGQQVGGGPQNGQNRPEQGTRADDPGGNEDKVQHGSGYTMFTPNEQKRRTIAQKAQREEDNYKRYKEKQKLGYVNYHGTVGGDSVPHSSARTTNSHTHQPPTSYHGTVWGGAIPGPSTRRTTSNTTQPRARKREEYKAEEKRREDEEYRKKKIDARQKADGNAERDRERQQRLDNDRRMKNEAFFNRLSQK